jgi:hypothetical protein
MSTVTTIGHHLLAIMLVPFSVATSAFALQETKAPTNIPSRIKVSKETTFVTEHFRSDGSVDYPAFLNERMGAGVAPENNLMAGFVRAVKPFHDREYINRVCSLIDVFPPHNPNPTFKPYDFAHLGREKVMYSFARSEFDAIKYQPWKSSEHEYSARWIEENSNVMDRFVDDINASTGLYTPFVHIDESGPLYHWNDRFVIAVPMAEFLRIRSMQRLGNCDVEGAQSDLLACRKLAMLLYQSKRRDHIYFASIVMQNAIEGEFQMAMASCLYPEDLAKYRSMVGSLKPERQCVQTFNYEMRFEQLVSVMRAERDEISIRGCEKLSSDDAKHVFEEMDWNALLMCINQGIDKMMRELNNDPANLRKGLVKAPKALFESDMSDEELRAARKIVMEADRVEKAAIFAQQYLKDYFDAIRLHAHYIETCQAREDVGDVALGLCQYRHDHGHVPSQLEELVPSYLQELPKDRFSGKPLVYRPKNHHFMLYSVGYDESDTYEQMKQYHWFFANDIGFHSDKKVWGFRLKEF